jgi:hypothetical protein
LIVFVVKSILLKQCTTDIRQAIHITQKILSVASSNLRSHVEPRHPK